jgi:hypothetical protein
VLEAGAADGEAFAGEEAAGVAVGWATAGVAVGWAEAAGVGVGTGAGVGGWVGAGVGVCAGQGTLADEPSIVYVALPVSLPNAPATARVCGPAPCEQAGAGSVMLAVHRPLPAM